ncbi:kazrin-like isoform X3 [Planococcus citri]|uniref:kazrin-like isoform X3 n=1 Tax=Planococcus citri TaxID=170843 RepID=UPI0031FA3D26
MALMRRLLVDAQAKIRKMVEENRQMPSRLESDMHNPHDEIVSLRDELLDTNRRMEHLNIKPLNTDPKNTSCGMPSINPENSSSSKSSKSSKNFDDVSPIATHKFLNTSSHRKFNAYLRDNSSSSSNSGGPCLEGKDSNLIVDDTNYVNRRKSKKSKSKHSRRRTDIDFHEDTEPPSPTPGPSSRNEFGLLESNNRLASGLNGDSTSMMLENERLKNEVYELRRLLSMQDNVISSDTSRDDVILQLHEDLDGQERVEALEKEIIRAKDVVDSAKAEANRLKNEKFELINEMKELYEALDDKEKQLRDFIRNYEHRIRENHEMLAQERAERERERWSLLRHARDEAERSLALAAQLDIKDQQLNEVHTFRARRQLSTAGYLSDQESIHSVSLGTRPANGRVTPSTGSGMVTVGDRGSCSADSGVRGSSDRESGATSAGGTPTITIDNVHKHRQHHCYPDADSISLVSSTAVPHIYQSVATPRDCSSPSLSPMNSQSFVRSLDNALLSKSVEQLSGPPPDLEPIRRNKNLRSFSSRSGVASTWGSISRVFSRTRHRKAHSPSSHDGDYESFSRSYSPLTEEGYTEKLRLLREAAHIPVERWRAPTVLAWIEVALGMPQYGPRCAENIKSGKVLLELNDVELENGLKITNPMHRKKLRLAIEEQRNPTLIRYPCMAQLGHTWVCNEWLPDIGLAQYAESFSKNMVDARMLDHLSKKEMEKYLNVTRKFHQVSISHGVHLLRMVKYDRQALAIRRLQCNNTDTDPIVWTNERFIQWARDIHLEEYADNLKDSGIHGALIVLEPSVNGDTMATALGIPPSRQMIRRHLAAELEQLILPARYDAFSQAEPIYETPVYRNDRNIQQ